MGPNGEFPTGRDDLEEPWLNPEEDEEEEPWLYPDDEEEP